MPGLPELRRLDLAYHDDDSDASARKLVFSLFPHWETGPGELKFKHFKEGITNTLLKATKVRPGATQEQLDHESVLIRAYGKGTEVLIDREREITSHHLLALHNLAPELLARFKNGMIYRYVSGRPCSPEDLRDPRVYRGLARKMGEWHAVISVSTQSQTVVSKTRSPERQDQHASSNTVTSTGVGEAKGYSGTIWAVIEKWINALPAGTPEEQERNSRLRKEFSAIVEEFADRPGLGEDGLVVGHCDLLSGNIIITPKLETKSPFDPEDEVVDVAIIDYEYATPCPAAFDLACHFSEWIGFDCDYNGIPTRSDRRRFLAEYLQSYRRHARRTSFNHLRHEPFKVPLNREDSGKELNGCNGEVKSRQDREEEELNTFCDEVDLMRGLPGFYWGVWAHVQASISDIDFDYAWYAKTRLQEYWDWQAERTGQRQREGREMPLREKRWTME